MLDIKDLISEGYSDQDILELIQDEVATERAKQKEELEKINNIAAAKDNLIASMVDYLEALGFELSDDDLNVVEAEIMKTLDIIENMEINVKEHKGDNYASKEVHISTKDGNKDSFLDKILYDLVHL